MTVEWPGDLFAQNVPWTGPAATQLRAQMDAEIVPRYAGISTAPGGASVVDPDDIYFTVVVFDGTEPVATGSLKRTGGWSEVKRIFVAPTHRRLGLAGLLLAEIETRAQQLGLTDLVLQTGFRQPEAIALYQNNGWQPIPNFGPYEADTVISRCFAKQLRAPSARRPAGAGSMAATQEAGPS